MLLIWRETALADLEEIEAYIAEENPVASRAIKERIMERVENLVHSPGIGRPGRVHDTREFVVSGLPYIVAYTVTESAVTVLAVIHGARRWPESF